MGAFACRVSVNVNTLKALMEVDINQVMRVFLDRYLKTLFTALEHRRTAFRVGLGPTAGGRGASAVTMATVVGPARCCLSHAALRSAVHCGPGKMAASWPRC